MTYTNYFRSKFCRHPCRATIFRVAENVPGRRERAALGRDRLNRLASPARVDSEAASSFTHVAGNLLLLPGGRAELIIFRRRAGYTLGLRNLFGNVRHGSGASTWNLSVDFEVRHPRRGGRNNTTRARNQIMESSFGFSV